MTRNFERANIALCLVLLPTCSLVGYLGTSLIEPDASPKGHLSSLGRGLHQVR